MRSALTVGLALVLGAAPAIGRDLIVPEGPLDGRFEQRNFANPIDFSVVEVAGRRAIQATGEKAASGLYQSVRVDVQKRPILRWHWRAERLPAGVDLSTKANEDFALGLFLAFGEPGIFSDAKTLAYAWTRTPQKPGTVVPSPRYPDKLRTIVLRRKNAPLGQWVQEKRNVLKDFRRAYGHAPERKLSNVALFCDNDQTGGALLGQFATIRAEGRDRAGTSGD